MRDVLRRVGAVAFALLLVVTSMTGAMGPASVGTAEAAEWFTDCDIGDSLVGAFLNNVLGGSDGCRFNVDNGDHVGTTQASAYSGARTLTESEDVSLTSVENHLEDTHAAAVTEAKMTIIREMNNGSNKSVAMDAANESIEDFYAGIERNLITEENAQSEYVYNTVDMAAVVDTRGAWTNVYDTYGEITESSEIDGKTTVNTTLLNGTTVSYVVPWAHIADGEGFNGVNTAGDDMAYYLGGRSVAEGTVKQTDLDAHAESKYSGASVRDKEDSGYEFVGPEGNTTRTRDGERYATAYIDIRNQVDVTKVNIEAYVNGVYSQYEPGEIDASDLLSPVELFSRASTDYQSTGYLGYAAAEFAAMGYGGDLNASHSLTYQGANYTGTLFYTGSEEVNLTTGETYNPDDYSGTFVMAYQSSNKSDIIDLNDGNFTISETVNVQTGEKMNSTATEVYVHETTNAADLAEELADLRKVVEKYQSSDSSGGGGFGFDGIGTADKGLIALVALAAILLVTRN